MRGFFRRMSQRLATFMYGRYGIDNLYWLLFALWLLFNLLSGFPFPPAVRGLFWILSIAALGIMFFRVFSRNIYRRQKEGQAFDTLWNRIVSFFRLQKNRFRDRKTKAYRRCPSCKAVLRFPRIKGTHPATCPKCRSSFTVRV